jgi:L-threonylcarbamoyladenylate synthase
VEGELRTVSPEEAAAALRAGGVVLVPTETVVGLVAAESGLSRVRDAKSREADKPITLLCSSAYEAFSLAREVPRLASKLADLYWPGPLTLVLDRPEGGTVGLRVPAGRAARELLSAYGGPLFATSANVSGEPAPHALEDVDPRVSGAVDVAVVGKPGSGEASAVVDLSGGGARLLRPATGLTEETLSRLAGS